MKKTGILIVNLGTPEDPSIKSVRKFLKVFLSDQRVVEIPTWLWQPILRTIILPLRPKKSAALYQKVWTKEGSPLLTYSQALITNLRDAFKNFSDQVFVELGMRYSQPSIHAAINHLISKNIDQLLILPMYPQYSATTTASIFDEVMRVLAPMRNIPALHFIKDYSENDIYISAIANSILEFWQTHPKEHLLFSYHGIPQRNIEKGDPYQDQCLTTTKLIVDRLQLKPNEWTIAFQSRLGFAKWLQPYTDQILEGFAKKGIKNCHVICPGFAVDCLETLEEIAIRGKEQFQAGGGLLYEYIPALNATARQSAIFTELANLSLEIK